MYRIREIVINTYDYAKHKHIVDKYWVIQKKFWGIWFNIRNTGTDSLITFEKKEWAEEYKKYLIAYDKQIKEEKYGSF